MAENNSRVSSVTKLRFTIKKLSPVRLAVNVCLLTIIVAVASPVTIRATGQSAPQGTSSAPEFIIARERARLMSNDEEERFDAVIRLGALGRRDAARVAATALSDKSVRVRAAAINAIGQLPEVELTVNLLKVLADKNEFVREQAAYAAGNLRGNQIIGNRLLEILRTDNSAEVVGAAVFALGSLANDVAVPDLIRVLNYTQRSSSLFRRSSRQRRIQENEFVRREAAIALGLIGDRRAVPVLIAQLNGERTPDDIRREAARALGLIGDASAKPALQAVLTVRDVFLAEIAFNALRRIERGS